MTGRWYHRNITGIEAEKLLHDYGQDGSFLIRPSQSTSNSYTLSVRCGNAFKHIKIQNNGDFYDIGEGGDKFATLAELVEHFILKETLRDKNDGTTLVLRYPLSYKEPTTERYYHGAISGSDATNLLLDIKAKPGSYLVRESRSDPQNYVLCVRCENNKIVHLVISYTKDGYTMQNCSKSYPTLDEFIIELAKICPIVDSKDNVVYLKQPLNASRVNAINLSNRVRDLEKDQKDRTKTKNGFAEEFESLQQQDSKLLYDRKEGEKTENRPKNRFKTILPFDHTRVVLSYDIDFDYINANYIKSDDTFGKTYIATQGPLLNTISDFWSMIWQESSQFILMITHETEKGRVKCCKYWPDQNQQVKYDSYIIKCVDIREYDDYLLRELIVSNLQCSEQERKIFHFQYLAWSDHSVPENVLNTLSFIEHYNRLYKQSSCETAVTVHCSAGIGRTGAIIVIDMIIDKIKHYGLQCDIDVQKTVLHLRSQRSGMVQTEKQYQFLYIALKEYIDLETKRQAMKAKQQKPIYLANTVSTTTTTTSAAAASPSISNSKSSEISTKPTTLPRNNGHRQSSRSRREVLLDDSSLVYNTESKLLLIDNNSEHTASNSNMFNDLNNQLTTSTYLQDESTTASGYLLPDDYNNNTKVKNNSSISSSHQHQHHHRHNHQNQQQYYNKNSNEKSVGSHQHSNHSGNSKLRASFQNSAHSFNSSNGSNSNLRKLQNSEYMNLYDVSQSSSMDKMNVNNNNNSNSDFSLRESSVIVAAAAAAPQPTNRSSTKSNNTNSNKLETTKLLPTPPVITNRTLMNNNNKDSTTKGVSSNKHQKSSSGSSTLASTGAVAAPAPPSSSSSSTSKPTIRGYSVDRQYNNEKEKSKKK